MTNIATLILENSVVVTINGNTRSVNDSHVAYEQIKNAIRNKEWDSIPALLDTKKAVKQYINRDNSGKVVVDEEAGRLVVKFDGKEMNNKVTDRITKMMRDGFDATPMVLFLENLMENPDFRAANDLIDWLEAGQMPITEDGYILAYKNVDKDFLDSYTRTIDNSPGQIVEMRRNEVNPDPNQTCSYGLHFCAQSYLNSYGGDRGKTIILKINPRDVVAFPKDYNLAKGRCCRYEVVGEHTKGVATTAFENETVDTTWSPVKEVETADFGANFRGLVNPTTREEILDTVKTPHDKVGVGSVVTRAEAAKFFGCTDSALRKRCARGASARWAGYNKVEILSA